RPVRFCRGAPSPKYRHAARIGKKRDHRARDRRAVAVDDGSGYVERWQRRHRNLQCSTCLPAANVKHLCRPAIGGGRIVGRREGRRCECRLDSRFELLRREQHVLTWRKIDEAEFSEFVRLRKAPCKRHVALWCAGGEERPDSKPRNRLAV